MSKVKKKQKAVSYSTDRVATMLYSNLLRDFRTSEGQSFFAGYAEDLQTNIDAFRAREVKSLGVLSVGRFKRIKQMEAVLKKYRFGTDAYTDDELSAKTLEKFQADQLRLHAPMPLEESGFRVCQRAREIARRILGEFPGDEVVNHVQFGRKSSIGCPLSLAYIDEKLSLKQAFTGTGATTEFFKNQVLPGDHILNRILSGHDFVAMKDQLNVDYLNLVEVPKTWETYRLITPLTLIGLFYSYGIGRIITVRLKECGLDIARLQGQHRQLVKQMSVNLRGATADLSAASDSITSALLNRVLPRSWYNALKKTFVRTLNSDDQSFSSVSVLPMGNGATFPTETLVFYCLTKAIGELAEEKGVYSVYGDDLIYPSRIHKYVAAVFPQLHLKLNVEKTYVSYPFRESCGSDYYRGEDVRPYFLKGEAKHLTRVRYEAFLYKVYNGLVARWDPLEIRDTLHWLLSELAVVTRTIYRVPPTFPDYSGIKVSQPYEVPFKLNFLSFEPVLIQFNNGSRWYQFKFLTETPAKRIVKMIQPYYWLAMQGITDEVVDEYGRNERARIPTRSFVPLVSKRSSLRWEKSFVELKPYFQKGRKIVRKRAKYTAVVASRSGATVSAAQPKTDSISDWI
jgi:hypothetical protein